MFINMYLYYSLNTGCLCDNSDSEIAWVCQRDNSLDKLYQTDVQVTFFKIQNAEHVFKPTGGEMQPSMEELIFIVISFFNNVLK